MLSQSLSFEFKVCALIKIFLRYPKFFFELFMGYDRLRIVI